MHTAGARVCGPTADGSLRRLARALRGCAASIKLLFRPGINATGRPVLGRRRSRVPLTQAAFFLLAALELENRLPLQAPLDATAIAAGTVNRWNALTCVDLELFCSRGIVLRAAFRGLRCAFRYGPVLLRRIDR